MTDIEYEISTEIKSMSRKQYDQWGQDFMCGVFIPGSAAHTQEYLWMLPTKVLHAVIGGSQHSCANGIGLHSVRV